MSQRCQKPICLTSDQDGTKLDLCDPELSASARKPLHPCYCSVYSVLRKTPDDRAKAGLQIQIRQTARVGCARSLACGHRRSGRSPRIGAKVCATKAPWYSGERVL